MTSDELNRAIAEVCDDDELAKQIGENGVFGGKTVPYIGWGWRNVDFSSKTYSFGVLPKSNNAFDPVDQTYIGFMEKNKWGYKRVLANEKELAHIVCLLEKAVTTRKPKDFIKANNAIQALKSKIPPDWE